MTREPLTLDRIDDLLAFLPAFETRDRTYVKRWAGGAGSGHVPYPIYEDDVLAFFRLVGRSWWMDPGYKPRQAAQMLEDDDFVQTSSIDDIRAMLTFCVRAERFGDGMWEYVLQTGRIQALLRRMAVLRDDPALGLVDEREEQPGREGEG